MQWWQIVLIVWASGSVGFVIGLLWIGMPGFQEEQLCPECRRREMHVVKYNEECG